MPPQLSRRWPNPFGMRQQQHVEKTKQPEQPGSYKLYPLTPGESPRLNQSRTRPVQPLMPQAPMQPASFQQVSPEAAANKFRTINQGLPDGVRYEPLDEETIRLLKDNGHIKDEPVISQSEVVSDSSPNPAISNIIESLTADEKQAQSRYRNLAENAADDDMKDLLTSLSNDCEVRIKHYSELCKLKIL